jgi:hypothetical protein
VRVRRGGERGGDIEGGGKERGGRGIISRYTIHIIKFEKKCSYIQLIH